MARINSNGAIQKPRKSRARPYTPPPDFVHTAGAQLDPETPSRSRVIMVKLLAQKDYHIPQEVVREITSVPPRVQSRIIASKQPRRLHNRPDSGPDPRGRKRKLTRSDTAAVGNFLDDDSTTLDEKGLPWQDLAESSGVELPKTYHFKPAGYRELHLKAIQRACKQDEKIINAKAEEEKLLDEKQATARIEHCNLYLGEGDKEDGLRPYSDD